MSYCATPARGNYILVLLVWMGEKSLGVPNCSQEKWTVRIKVAGKTFFITAGRLIYLFLFRAREFIFLGKHQSEIQFAKHIRRMKCDCATLYRQKRTCGLNSLPFCTLVNRNSMTELEIKKLMAKQSCHHWICDRTTVINHRLVKNSKFLARTSCGK